MRLLFILLFIPTTLSTLCETLLLRSIAAEQPFQLPIYENDEYDAQVALATVAQPPWNMTVEIDGSWFLVLQHNYTHLQLLKAFGCEKRSKKKKVPTWN